MSSWSEERRRNQAAEAEQRRLDEDARAERRQKERAAEAARVREEKRKDREEKRAEQVQRRRDKAQRKAARTARREKTLTPGNVYRKGTLGLVAASAAAALPAQIAYFVKKSLMLLPVPFALEGAAWVMAAGVAYADEKNLPAWVRWLLRAFCINAAGFAARINYLHGSAEGGATVGWGLAAVTMLGPLFFEVRQWVLTLTAGDPKARAESRARARHDRKRRRDHRDVAKLAKRLMTAAPYGALSFEDAFAKAWAIRYGTTDLGMTPRMHTTAARSAVAFTSAQDPAPVDDKTLRRRILDHFVRPNRTPAAPLRYVLPTPATTVRSVTGKPQVVTDLPPGRKKPASGPKKAARRQPPPHRRSKGDSVPFHPLAKTQAADTARQHMTVNGHHH